MNIPSTNERNIPINKGNYSLDSPDREAAFAAHLSEHWEEEYRDYRRKWENNPRTFTVSEYPLLVDLELSTCCNLRCPMCYTITDAFTQRVPPRLMDFDLFRKVIDEIGGHTPAVRLSLRGEPTIHPRFVDAVRYAKQHGIREVSTLTNGSTLTRDFFRLIMDAGIDWITLSVDGMGDTYERIRKPLRFADTLQKIRDIHAIKAQSGRHRPVIKIQSVWPAIKDDPGGFYRTFAPIADLIAFNPLIDYLGNDGDLVYMDGFSCCQPYQRMVIGADGRVMMCSNDEESTVIVGDADRETVHAIWHGAELDRVRRLHRECRALAEMAVCRRCYLPRRTEDGETASVNGRTFTIKNYVRRSQVIGT